MFIFSPGRKIWGSVWVLAATFGCSSGREETGAIDSSGDAERGITTTRITPESRLQTCSQDPRVMAGLVSPDMCAGADIFLGPRSLA